MFENRNKLLMQDIIIFNRNWTFFKNRMIILWSLFPDVRILEVAVLFLEDDIETLLRKIYVQVTRQI